MQNTISIKKSVFLLFHYFIGNNFYPFIFAFIYGVTMGVDKINSNLISNISIFSTVFITVTSVIIVKDFIKQEIISFKTNSRSNIQKTIIGAFFLLGTGLLLSNIIASFTDLDSTSNQTAITNVFMASPMFFFLEGVIAAPIIEEIIFRGIIFNKLSRKFNIKIALISSSVLFAGIHFLSIIFTHDFSELPFFISYFTMSIIINSIYLKTNSLCGAILAHSANNLAAFLSLLSLI